MCSGRVMEALNVSGAAQDALYLVIRLLLEWCEKLSGEQKPKRFGLSCRVQLV